MRRNQGLRPTQPRMRDAPYAKQLPYGRLSAFIVTPSTSIWIQTGPLSGEVNCGRKAIMKSSTFGFSRLVMKPCQKASRASPGWAASDTSAAFAHRIMALMPR